MRFVMNLSQEEFELTIKKTLQTNQWIVFFSIMVSLSLLIWDENNVFWSLLLLSIGSFSLIGINQCKNDRRHFQSGLFVSIKGTVIDSFPQDDKKKLWVVFIQEKASGKMMECITPIDPQVELNQVYDVWYTPKMKILVKLG